MTEPASQGFSVELSSVTIRCGCGNPDSHRGVVCPSPRALEDNGVIGRWNSLTDQTKEA